MRTHTSNFKNSLTGIRQTDNKILYTKNGTTKTLTSDNIFRLSKTTNTDLFKTVMKTFEFESDIKFTTDTTFNLQSGLLVNSSYEYLNYGNYVLKDKPEYDLNSKRYTYTCYDKMLYTMKDYVKPTGLTFPISVRSYINTLATACGLTFTKASSTFVNYNVNIAQDNFEQGNYTFRDILDYLAQIIGGWFIINDNDELDIKYPTETNEEFSNDYLLNINVDFNKKYGPVNSLVFSRSSGADNIYRKDQTSIDTYGLCEIKFSDNPFLEGTDRDNFIDGIFNQIKGLEFYTMDVETTGLMFIDIGDLYSFRIGNDFPALKSGLVKSGIEKARAFTSGARKCLMLNDELDLSSGISEKIYTDEPETTETDYKSASLSDNELKQAILTVNKATAEIQLKVSKNEVISAINLSPEEIEINANKIKLEGYVSINGGFEVDEYGNFKASSGNIGGINISNSGLYYSGSSSDEGFGLWKNNIHNDGTGYIIFHAGGNNSNIGGAKFKVYQSGGVSMTYGNYYFNMGITTGNPNVSGLNVGGYGVKAYSGIVATGFGITDSDSGKSGTFILKHGTQNYVVYLTFTGGILTAYDIV